MLTTFALDNYVYQSLRAGASGFMVKDAPPEEIAAAVRIVANGAALLAPSVTRTVIEEFARHPSPPDQPPFAVTLLTPRERNVLDLLIAGLSNPEICDRLYISDATAKTHVARILQKLNVRDRVQVMIYAYESGLIMPGPQRGSRVPLKLRHEAAQRRTLPERHPHRIGFLSRHSVPATVPRQHAERLRGSTLCNRAACRSPTPSHRPHPSLKTCCDTTTVANSSGKPTTGLHPNQFGAWLT